MNAGARSRVLASQPAPVLALLAVLAGCAPAAEDLDAWTQQQRASVKPTLAPLAEPPRFDPVAYTSAQREDPFDPRRIAPTGSSRT